MTMVVPRDSDTPRALFAGTTRSEDGAASGRVRREFRELAVACRTLAETEPALITRISVSLSGGDDPDGPGRIADFALALANAHGFEAEVEAARGWVMVVFSRREEES